MNRRTALLATIALLTFLTLLLPLQTLDKASEKALDDSITLAAGTYATARITNGVVSVIAQSQIELQPGGLGVSLAAGQILDPLDDATERVSDLAITALGLLGTMRILTWMFTEPLNVVLPLFGILSFVLVAFSVRFQVLIGIANFSCRAFLWLVLVKATVPMMLGVSVWADQTYFAPQIERALQTLSFINELEEISTEPPASTDSSWLNWLQNAQKYAEERIASAVRTTQLLRENFDGMMDALTDLFTAFVGKLVIQVFLLPIAVIWAWRLVGRHWLGQAGLIGRQLDATLANQTLRVAGN
ncbi:MAG: hypothetical protein H7A01_18220 [Hahellaceae bacterium]|jgi:hypothetical protein|nr:hypothetical protein [Hahellaceae bacterium]